MIGEGPAERGLGQLFQGGEVDRGNGRSLGHGVGCARIVGQRVERLVPARQTPAHARAGEADLDDGHLVGVGQVAQGAPQGEHEPEGIARRSSGVGVIRLAHGRTSRLVQLILP